MRVIEQVLGDNGTEQRGLKKQKIVEKLMTEVALVAERPRRIKKTEEPATAVGGSEETRRSEEVGGLEEAGKPGVTRGTRELALAPERLKEIERLEETGVMGELELAGRKSEEARRLWKLAAALSLSWSNCWQAFVLAAVLFYYYFFFLNHLVFF